MDTVQRERARGLTAFGFHDPIQAQRRQAWEAVRMDTVQRERDRGLTAFGFREALTCRVRGAA